MHRIFKNSFLRYGEYVQCTDLVGGLFSSSNPIPNPYDPGKSVLDTIKGCGMGCSGGGVGIVDGTGRKVLLTSGSCLNATGCWLNGMASALHMDLVKLCSDIKGGKSTCWYKTEYILNLVNLPEENGKFCKLTAFIESAWAPPWSEYNKLKWPMTWTLN